MTVHVFVGPSCPEPLVTKNYPEFILHGPVKHGDLFQGTLSAGDVAVLVDGIYHHRLALRHKEILDAVARGVAVLGAASIGALRAAELDRFGMVGVGRVYRWYQDGVFDGDDAVSVAHNESGSPSAINIPLVNLYAAVLAACDAGMLSLEAGRRLMARFEHEYYPLRTMERVLAIARECGETPFADWYSEQRTATPDAFDQKQADALEAFALAARLGSRTSSGPLGTASGDRDWRTEYHRRWRNRFAAAAPDLHHRLAYQQIFDVRFPDVWWDFLHSSADQAGALPSGGLRAHVLRQLGPSAVQWLDDVRLRPRITRLLCPLPDLADPDVAKLLLRRETAQDRVQASDWLEQMRRHLDTHPDRSLGRIREAVCTRLLAGIWGVASHAEMAGECAKRGFPSLRQAADAFRPFTIGHLSSVRASGERDHV
ncbi:TfuA-like protein [Streptomyces sp. NPDC005761]|uniref:TfuA-like protein n=1 Tax=unclassified Streptomyces TaxID=2593676 RepID=UPI0033D75B25